MCLVVSTEQLNPSTDCTYSEHLPAIERRHQQGTKSSPKLNFNVGSRIWAFSKRLMLPAYRRVSLTLVSIRTVLIGQNGPHVHVYMFISGIIRFIH